MELSTSKDIDVLKPIKAYGSMLVLFLFVMLALPALYNLGSSEIGCPIYEWRTGDVCYRILG